MSEQNVQEWLRAELAFAALLEDGAPTLVLNCEPFGLVYANRAALALLSSPSVADLSARLQTSTEHGARRLRDLAELLPAGAQRLERLRFTARGGSELYTMLCRRGKDAAKPHLALAALGLSEADLRRLNRAPFVSAASSPENTPDVLNVTAPDLTPAPQKPMHPDTLQRLVFQTDANGRLTHISPEFVNSGLRGAHGAQGETLQTVADSPELTAALATHQTWRNVELLWPLEDSSADIPVTLSGAPIFDSSKHFKGYRGFGLMHFDELILRQTEPETRENSIDSASPSHDHVSSVATHEIIQVASSPLHAAQEQITHMPDDGHVATHVHAPVHEISSSLSEPQHSIASHHEIAPDLGQTDFAHEHHAQVDDEFETVLPPPADDLTLDHAAKPSPSEEVGDLTPPLHSPVAVARAEQALHGHHVSAVSNENVVQLNPSRPFQGADQDGVHLSNSERLAFREIARALGARVEDETTTSPAKAEIKKALDSAKAVESTPNILEPTPTQPATDQAATHAVRAEASERAIPESEPITLTTPVESADYGLAHNSAALLDRLPVGILVSRGDVPIFTNKIFLEMLGYADADQFYSEDGLHHLFAPSEPAHNAAPGEKSPMALQTRRGEVIHAEAHLQSITWNGDPASLLALRRLAEPDPMPRLKSLELELRDREAETRELHDILDTATDGILVLDQKGHILEVNRSAEALLGFDHSDIIGQPFTILLNPESHAAALDYLEGMKANGVASVLNDGRDVIGRERHGRAVPLFMTLGRVNSGQKGKFCAVLRDVTHWKKAETELNDARKEAERSSAQKSDFLAKISHEIRTPLNAIIGFAEVIMQERFGPVGNDRYKDYLKDIHASGMHVMSLVNDLLDLSKIESGKLELSFTSVNANKIIQDCVALMQPQATKERVVIRVSLAPRLPNIVCDERSLRQIVLNLLSNAVKFNDPGGQVIVSTALTDAGHAVIRVRDTGIGMDETDIEHALEPFRQLDTARKANGTGLGLPLTKAMVEANRAAFSIKSKRGDGTLVEVMFPPTRVLAE